MGILTNLSNRIKGTVGELKVKKKLNPLLFGRVYHRLINNLLLLDENGKSHQIDHIEIRENGIFCIETKNYIGIITGQENSEKWVQHLYKEKHEFYNPIRQNKSHIYHLNTILKHQYPIYSIIVMVNNNAKSISCPYVINLNQLKKYLKNFKSETSLKKEEMDKIYQTLIQAKTKLSTRQHVSNIQNTKKDLINEICPRCQAKLILKIGQYGEFYGCSNFPKCKFKINKEKLDRIKQEKST